MCGNSVKWMLNTILFGGDKVLFVEDESGL